MPEKKGKGKEKEKTTLFGANLMKSQALYWAAQVSTCHTGGLDQGLQMSYILCSM